MLEDRPSISSLLLQWFEKNKRDLPWRGISDPYLIWVSEIILQQTRVVQGLPYYMRFRERFPDVRSLADASEQEVLTLWQGLGYYSRARNMHAAAKEVMLKHNGSFPKSFTEIKALKGIGDYTASAIASLAFGLPHAAVDGNVYRVLARLKGIDIPINTAPAVKVFKSLAQEILDKKNPGRHNEALMEFGATVCTPQNPGCAACPLKMKCVAFKKSKVTDLPVKLKTLKQKERHLHYLCLWNNKGVWLKKRAAGDIWQGLYEFPLLERTNSRPPTQEELEALCGYSLHIKGKAWEKRHLLSHQVLNISFYMGELNNFTDESFNMHIFVPYLKLDEYPMPKPVEIFTRRFLREPKK